MLAGGVTSVEQEFLEARPSPVAPRAGSSGAARACFCSDSEGPRAPLAGRLFGYAEGFGKTDLLDAIRACLEDAGIPARAVGAVRTASVHDARSVVGRSAGPVSAAIVRSPFAGLHSASFPLAVAEAADSPQVGRAYPSLSSGAIASWAPRPPWSREGSDAVPAGHLSSFPLPRSPGFRRNSSEKRSIARR